MPLPYEDLTALSEAQSLLDLESSDPTRVAFGLWSCGESLATPEAIAALVHRFLQSASSDVRRACFGASSALLHRFPNADIDALALALDSHREEGLGGEVDDFFEDLEAHAPGTLARARLRPL